MLLKKITVYFCASREIRNSSFGKKKKIFFAPARNAILLLIFFFFIYLQVVPEMSTCPGSVRNVPEFQTTVHVVSAQFASHRVQ